MFTSLNLLHVACQVSPVTCQVSPVTCQVLYVTLKENGQSGETSRWRVCYKRGLPSLRDIKSSPFTTTGDRKQQQNTYFPSVYILSTISIWEPKTPLGILVFQVLC